MYLVLFLVLEGKKKRMCLFFGNQCAIFAARNGEMCFRKL